MCLTEWDASSLSQKFVTSIVQKKNVEDDIDAFRWDDQDSLLILAEHYEITKR